MSEVATPGRTGRAERGMNRRLGAPSALSGKRGDKRALYHCNYCRKDISNRIRIKCAVCPDFDLCLECFSVGAEIRPHKSEHAYRVVDNLSFPLYEPTWGADEELLLLEAVDLFGYGNWAAISEHVGTKTLEDCKGHYFSIFIEHDEYPLPKCSKAMMAYDKEVPKDGMGRQPVVTTPKPLSKTVGGEPSTPMDAEDAKDGKLSCALPALTASFATPKPKQKQGEARATTPGSAGQGNATKAEPPHSSEQERHTAAQKKARLHEGLASAGGKSSSQGNQEPEAPHHEKNAMSLTPHSSGLATPSAKPDNKSEVTGYNAFRHEFDPEYDNDAETIIADIEFSEQDSEEDIKRKTRIMRVYNLRQDLREGRRDHILKKGLLDVAAMEAEEATLWPIEKLLSSQLRPFARFEAPQKIRELREGLAVEHCLRARISELQECRAAGVKKLCDAEEYGQRKKQRLGVAAVVAIQGLQLPAALQQQLQQQQAALAGVSSRPVRAAALANPLTNGSAAALEQAEEQQSPGSLSPGPLPSAAGAAAAFDGAAALPFLLNWRISQGKEFDISEMPGLEHLKPEERKLCSCLRLTPAHYLAVKEQMIRQAGSVEGKFTRSRACELMSTLDAMKVTQIYDLLLKDGWIGQG